jgi:hypothetical protein
MHIIFENAEISPPNSFFYLSLVFFPLGVIQFFFNYAKNLALFLLLTAKRLSSMFSFKFLNIMLYIEISFSMKIGYYNKN